MLAAVYFMMAAKIKFQAGYFLLWFSFDRIRKIF